MSDALLRALDEMEWAAGQIDACMPKFERLKTGANVHAVQGLKGLVGGYGVRLKKKAEAARAALAQEAPKGLPDLCSYRKTIPGNYRIANRYGQRIATCYNEGDTKHIVKMLNAWPDEDRSEGSVSGGSEIGLPRTEQPPVNSVSEVTDAPAPTNPTREGPHNDECSEPLLNFVEWALETGPWSGCGLDGADIQEKALELGIIHEVPFDPERHDDAGVGMTKGDPFYELVPTYNGTGKKAQGVPNEAPAGAANAPVDRPRSPNPKEVMPDHGTSAQHKTQPPSEVGGGDPKPPYFRTRCEHCGWEGSSEDCKEHPTGMGDADVSCPNCGKAFLCDHIERSSTVSASVEEAWVDFEAYFQPDALGEIHKSCFKAGWQVHAQQEWRPTHQHYKGGLYRVIAEGRYESDLEAMTIYDDAEGNVWVRPTAIFNEFLAPGAHRFTALPTPPEEER